MNKEIAAVFDQRLADYKQMVILRQEECTQIAEVCDRVGRQLSSTSKKFKNWLIVLDHPGETRIAYRPAR
jgi:hypothetical protein